MLKSRMTSDIKRFLGYGSIVGIVLLFSIALISKIQFGEGSPFFSTSPLIIMGLLLLVESILFLRIFSVQINLRSNTPLVVPGILLFRIKLIFVGLFVFLGVGTLFIPAVSGDFFVIQWSKFSFWNYFRIGVWLIILVQLGVEILDVFRFHPTYLSLKYALSPYIFIFITGLIYLIFHKLSWSYSAIPWILLILFICIACINIVRSHFDNPRNSIKFREHSLYFYLFWGILCSSLLFLTFGSLTLLGYGVPGDVWQFNASAKIMYFDNPKTITIGYPIFYSIATMGIQQCFGAGLLNTQLSLYFLNISGLILIYFLIHAYFPKASNVTKLGGIFLFFSINSFGWIYATFFNIYPYYLYSNLQFFFLFQFDYKTLYFFGLIVSMILLRELQNRNFNDWKSILFLAIIYNVVFFIHFIEIPIILFHFIMFGFFYFPPRIKYGLIAIIAFFTMGIYFIIDSLMDFSNLLYIIDSLHGVLIGDYLFLYQYIENLSLNSIKNILFAFMLFMLYLYVVNYFLIISQESLGLPFIKPPKKEDTQFSNQFQIWKIITVCVLLLYIYAHFWWISTILLKESPNYLITHQFSVPLAFIPIQYTITGLISLYVLFRYPSKKFIFFGLNLVFIIFYGDFWWSGRIWRYLIPFVVVLCTEILTIPKMKNIFGHSILWIKNLSKFVKKQERFSKNLFIILLILGFPTTIMMCYAFNNHSTSRMTDATVELITLLNSPEYRYSQVLMDRNDTINIMALHAYTMTNVFFKDMFDITNLSQNPNPFQEQLLYNKINFIVIRYIDNYPFEPEMDLFFLNQSMTVIINASNLVVLKI